MGTRWNRLAEAVLTSTNNLIYAFSKNIKKNIRFFLFENFHFFGGNIFNIFEQEYFRNVTYAL